MAKNNKAWTPAQRKKFMATMAARRLNSADALPDAVPQEPSVGEATRMILAMKLVMLVERILG